MGSSVLFNLAAMTKFDVKDKVFVITGSGQGIGKAFAARLLDAGAKVCLSDVTMELGEEALKEFEQRHGSSCVCLYACDVTKTEQFEGLLESAEKYFGVECVDVLVNNAGINTNHGWRKCVEVTLLGVMIGTELALKKMRSCGKECQIITTASMASFGPMDESGLGYSVSKFGVLGMTRSLATSYSKHGVSIKCICPSWTDTELVNNVTVAESRVVIDKQLKLRGVMPPEFVAEGFYRLVTHCENGTALAAIKGLPYLELADYNVSPPVPLLAVLAKLVNLVTGPEVVTAKHLRMAFLAVVIFIIFSLVVVF